MEIQARFTHDKLDFGKDNTPHLVVSVKAPTLDWVQKRPAICVVPVVDLSGSMKGDKIAYAKKSLLKLVDHLQEGDVAGLVGFETRVHMLVEPGEVTPELKAKMRQAIENMRPMGGTNFSEGLLRSVAAVHSLDLSPKYLKRVIMFTDGQPTEGITTTAQILSLLEQQRGSVTVSAFGYGSMGGGGGIWNGCNQTFLEEFATKGEGNYAYVQDPDDALAAFGNELGGLLSTCATNLSLTIEPVNGHRITKVVSNVEHEEDVTGQYDISAASILSEETQHFVFETLLKEQSKAFPREANVFNVKLTFEQLKEDGSRETKTVETMAKVQFVKAGDVQVTPHKEVDEVAALHRMVRAQLEAEEMAKKGNYQQAQQHMQDLSKFVVSSGHAQVAAAAVLIGTRLGNAMTYNSSSGFLRSMSRGVTRGYGTSSYDPDARGVLLSCNLSTSNAAMAQAATSFQVDADMPPTPAFVPAFSVPDGQVGSVTVTSTTNTTGSTPIVNPVPDK